VTFGSGTAGKKGISSPGEHSPSRRKEKGVKKGPPMPFLEGKKGGEQHCDVKKKRSLCREDAERGGGGGKARLASFVEERKEKMTNSAWMGLRRGGGGGGEGGLLYLIEEKGVRVRRAFLQS